MAQHSNEHLTIAQLSSYLDKELAPDELALCDAHLQTCQPCQATLADLRLTSALLRGMPQVETPRSFVLPTNIAVLPQTPTRQRQQARQPGRSQAIWKRSLRALSTLAAVLGLIFILAGAISTLPHSGGASNTATSSAPGFSNSAPQAASNEATKIPPRASQATQQASATSTASAKQQATPDQHLQANTPEAGPPPALDPGQPAGRLGIGSLLFLLGILGLVLTRRLRRDSAY